MHFDLFDFFRKFQHIHFNRATNRNCISPIVLTYFKYNFHKQHTLYITVQRRCKHNVGDCWNITVGKLLLQWSMSHSCTKEVKEYDVYLRSAMLLITLYLCVSVRFETCRIALWLGIQGITEPQSCTVNIKQYSRMKDIVVYKIMVFSKEKAKF